MALPPHHQKWADRAIANRLLIHPKLDGHFNRRQKANTVFTNFNGDYIKRHYFRINGAIDGGQQLFLDRETPYVMC